MTYRPGDSRRIAWKTLVEFERTRANPDELLDHFMPLDFSERDRALAWEMTKGTIKYQKKLDFVAQAYIKAPVAKQKPGVLAALRLGLYQMIEMRNIPQFAAVDETVRVVSVGDMKRDAGFVNAVLRSFIRDPGKADFPDPEKQPIEYLSTLYSYPEWLVNRWHSRYGFGQTEEMLAANNIRPATNFKIISSKIASAEALKALEDADIDVEPGRYFSDFLRSSEGHDAIKTDMFKSGGLIVQDESQGLPIYLLDPEPGSEVLDLCSAPGGKTIALADKVGPTGHVISLDKDSRRLGQVIANVKRVGLENVEFVDSDLLQFAPGRKFRYILLDVPCSGLGTLSHNVDLRWTKTEKDIKALARIQSALLAKATELLEEGGNLVYSTCTTEPDEIEDVLTEFTKARPEFHIQQSPNPLLAPFVTELGIYRTWPHKHGIGGGGFALLRKKDGTKDS